jgi:hypothetical protein
MNPRVLLALLLAAAVGVAVALPPRASAVPVFARKYGFTCTMCHSNMPRLNDFGVRYRANGYRLPGGENEERTVLETPTPLALRTSGGYVGVSHNQAAGMPDLSDFKVFGLDLLSAGLLGRSIGYFMVYTPQIAEDRGVEAQEGRLEMASVVFSDIACSPWLNLRVGRYEPAYVGFSVKRQLSVNTPEIYDAAFPGGIAVSETQSGVELSGHGRSPFSYAAGVVGGGRTNSSIDSPGDVYGRASWVFGTGEGQTAGQRIGMIGYLGQARPESGPDRPRKSFYRAGADASLNMPMVNLALQWTYASDDELLWSSLGATEKVNWWGGFGEISVMPRVDLVGFARVDVVDMPKILDQDVTRLTAGGRYYFEDNVALHTEFSYRKVKATAAGLSDPKEASITTRVDFAF